MNKYDHPTATPEGEFTDGDPADLVATPPTKMVAAFPNVVQRELVNLVEGSGLVLDPQDDAQVLAAVQIIGASAGGRALRNSLINGSFELWQRGPSITVAPAAELYTADRWVVIGATTGTLTVDRATLDPTATEALEVAVPRGALNAMRVTITGSGTGSRLEQRIEFPERSSGQVETFSIRHRLDDTNPDSDYSFDMRIRLHLGAGQGIVDLGSKPVSVTTGDALGWRLEELTVTVPSFEGLTLGADPYLSVELVDLVGATSGAILLAMAQMERAGAASRFEWRPASIEYELAARYFQKSYDLDDEPGVGLVSNPLAGAAIGMLAKAETSLYPLATRFRVPMRTTPTVTWFEPSTGTAGRVTLDAGGPAILSGNGLANPVATGFPLVAAPVADGTALFAHWTADAEL